MRWPGFVAAQPVDAAISAAVALLIFGIALNDGGYSLSFIAGGAFVVWCLVLALLFTGLRREHPQPVPGLAAAACLAALTGWTALSIVWASDTGLAFAEVVRVAAYLGLFALVLLVSSRGAGARPWLTGLAFGLLGIVILGLATRFDPAIGDATGEVRARLSYPLGYWNGLAACAAFSSTLSLWFSVNAQTRLWRSLACAALPPAALAIFLTGSRGGAVAAALGTLLVLGMGPRRSLVLCNLLLAACAAALLIVIADTQDALVDGLTNDSGFSQGRLLLAVVVAAVSIVGLLRWALDGWRLRIAPSRGARRLATIGALLAVVAGLVAIDLPERLDEFKRPPPPLSIAQADGDRGISRGFTGSGRYQFWETALDAFEHQPLHGIGAGQYENWWNQHGSFYWVLRDAHSLLFESLAELGLVGFALTVASFLAIPLACGWRRRRGPRQAEVSGAVAVLGVGTVAAAVDWTWELPAAFLPVVIAAALLTGAATRMPGSEVSGPRRPGSSRFRFGLLFASVALAWGALWCSADLLLTRVSLDRSRSAVAAGELREATSAARDAVALQPWAAQPRIQLGLVLEARGELVPARAALGAAARRAPEDWRIPFLISRVERRLGSRAASEAALARARSLDPREPLLHSTG